MSPYRSARIGERAWLGIDLAGALGLTRDDCSPILSLSSLLPTVVCDRLRRALLAVPRGGRDHRRASASGSRASATFRRGDRLPRGIPRRALTWLLAALFAGLPYLLSDERQLSRPMDAFFEGMSGFTTTGATVVTNVDALDRSILIWRQLSQWLGGMGIIVLALAVLPRLRIGGRQMFESELPGPEVNQLAERIRDTARRLWLLYIGLTLVLIAALLVVGLVGLDDQLSPFDAVGNALSTMPLGGFATDNRSIEPFAPVTQWIVAAFMALAGVNFALLYRAIVRRDPGALRRDEEARLYVVFLLLGSILVFAELVHAGLFSGDDRGQAGVLPDDVADDGDGVRDHRLRELADPCRHGDDRPDVRRRLRGLTDRVGEDRAPPARREDPPPGAAADHPPRAADAHQARTAEPVEERTLRAVLAFVVLYIGIFIVGAALLAIDARFANVPLGITDAVAASAGTLGNVGPGLGFAGPMGSYAPFSDFSKLVMALLMWVGRLEVLPVLVLLTRGYWRV